MSRKPPKKRENRDDEEYKRFLQTAEDLGADQTPEEFERAFKRVAGKQTKRHIPKQA